MKKSTTFLNRPADIVGNNEIGEKPEMETFKLLKEGISLHQQGRLAQAKALYEEVLLKDPHSFDAWHLSGVIAAQSNNPSEAVDLIDKAIKINPSNAAALTNRGNALKALKRFEEAVMSYDSAIKIKSDYAEAYSNRGATLAELNRFDEALLSYDRAIAIVPSFAIAHNNRGNALQRLSLLEQAVASYERAISLKPDYAEAYNNKGNVLQNLRRLQEAVNSYDRAIAIRPDYADAYNNRGMTLHKSEQLEDALESYDHAITIKPDYADAYNNRGLALQELNRVMEAISSYDRAIEIKPNYAQAHWNKSLALLLIGDFEQGWKLFEWRWRQGKLKLRAETFSEPLWLGNVNIQNKTIFLYAEQGLGDTIQFCRYAKLIKDLGAIVCLEVPKPCYSLLRNLGFVDFLIEQGKNRPAFDYHCPLMSLPLAFGTKLSSIPMSAAYLIADEKKVDYWAEKISGNTTGRLKVGVVWSGGFRPNQPELWGVHERRNIPLDVFARAFSMINADFFSLQKGDPAESAIRGRELEYWPQGNFYNYSNELYDFSDTAALIKNLDVIISVDTSTAHLSAALGKPTWILNRFDTCWRWLLDRNDSPWYQSVKLYRQGEDRDWEKVLRVVASDLLSE